MADEDRFAGIGDALEGDVDDPVGEAGDDRDGEEPVEESEAAPESSASSPGGPAFSFDEASQQTVYPRPETWRELRAALSTADAQLLTEHGIGDVEGRELHDAALAIAADRVDELVERVVASRDE